MTELAKRFRIRPASAETWNDLVQVMGTRGDPARCWCQWFHLGNRAFSETSVAAKREALRHQTRDATPAPGVLAYLGDEVVGWCQVGPKRDFRRLGTAPISRALKGETDAEGTWAITCFVVRIGRRGQGVASALLDGAIAHARRHGARRIEAYPVDASARKVSASALYHGTSSMFLRAGFAEIRRPNAARPVMRLEVSRRARVASPGGERHTPG